MSASALIDPLFRLEACDRHWLGGHSNALRLQVGEGVFEPVQVITLGEILAVVAAAAFFTRQRSGGDQLGTVQHEAELEGLHEVGVEGPPAVLNGDPRKALFERSD